MAQGTLKIHSENILPIIKKWMYSDRDIFVRELVSNSCDALQKVRILRERGELEAADEEFRIDIRIDQEAKTLCFEDTGIGMNGAEIENYIAQIAFSGAEDFVAKYKGEEKGEQIIGHFGLGFYSAYMVASSVEIDSLSYRKGEAAAHWVCDGSPDYELDAGQRSQRGTSITLHVGDEHSEFLEEARLSEILTRYCRFLPFPIYLNDKQINPKEPLWIKAPSECSEQEYLEFYRHLFPFQEDPLFWIHLNVDYPFHLQGILYFPKLKERWDPSQKGISLYCNRVFVSDQVKDIIPDFLLPLQGVIDSPDIPLNVSRSSLSMDRTVRQLAGHISKKVADRLSTQYRGERERFLAGWQDVEWIVKLGALSDEKFYERVKELLLWKNSEGEWTTIEEYLERNGEKTDKKAFYTADLAKDSQFVGLYKERGVEVLTTGSYLDSHLISFLEQKIDGLNFQRIDSAVEDVIVDKDKEAVVIDEQGKTEAAHIADFVRRHLDTEEVEVEAKSLASQGLPAFIMMDEQMRRMRDYARANSQQADLGQLAGLAKRTFVVNTNSPLVRSLQKLETSDPALAKELVQYLFDLSLLSQREMEPEHLQGFLSRCTQVMEKLAGRASSES